MPWVTCCALLSTGLPCTVAPPCCLEAFWPDGLAFCTIHGCSSTLGRGSLSFGFRLRSCAIRSLAPEMSLSLSNVVSNNRLFVLIVGIIQDNQTNYIELFTCRKMRRPSNIYIKNTFVGFLVRFGFKWGFSSQKLVTENSKRPQVNFFIVIFT